MKIDPSIILEIEHNLTMFFTCIDDETRRQYEEIINEWTQHPDFFSHAIYFIQNSNKASTLMAVLTFLKNALVSNQIEDTNILNTIFLECLNRLHSQQITCNEKIAANLIYIEVLLTVLQPDFFTYYEQFSLDELVCYFAMLYSEVKAKHEISDSPLSNIFNNNMPNIIHLLEVTPVNQYWVMLHECAISKLDSISVLSNLLPKIQQAAKEMIEVPALLQLFDCIVDTDGFNFLVEDLMYVQNLITIFIDLAEAAITEGEENQIGWASYIWNLTIDLNLNFYGAPELANFLNIVLDRFFNSLVLFPELSLSDFYILLDIVCCFFQYIPVDLNEETEKLVYMHMFRLVDYIFTLIDSEQPEFRSNQFEKAIAPLFGSDEQVIPISNPTPTHMPTLAKYMSDKLENPTAAVYYTYACLSKKLRKVLGTQVAKSLAFQNVYYSTTLKCISKCGKYGEDFAPVLVPIVYQHFYDSPPCEVINAIYTLSKTKTAFFANDFDSYVLPLLGSCESAQIEYAPKLIAALIYILPYLEISTENLLELMNKPLSLMIMVVNQTFETFNEVNPNYETTIRPMFKAAIVTQREEMIYKKQILLDAFSEVFSKILQVISSYWMETDHELQNFLCLLIHDTILYSWIGNNQETIINWVEEVLFNEPIPMHIHICYYLQDKYKFMPHEQVINFITNLYQNIDKINEGEVLQMFSQTFKLMATFAIDNPAAFVQTFDTDFLLYPILNTNNPSLLASSIYMLCFVTRLEYPIEFFQNLIQLLVPRILNQYRIEACKTGMVLLRQIGLDKIGSNEVGNFFVQSLGFQNEETQEFMTLITCREPSHEMKHRYVDISLRLIQIYKQSISSSY